VLASTVPNCKVYDPAFAYELAVIIEDGLRRMYGEKPEDVFYYITLYNEMISMPAMPDGAKEGILRGLYRYKARPRRGLHEPGADRGQRDGHAGRPRGRPAPGRAPRHGAEIWSATSYKTLRENALAVERWNRLHPTDVPRVPYISHVLGANGGSGRPWP